MSLHPLWGQTPVQVLTSPQSDALPKWSEHIFSASSVTSSEHLSLLLCHFLRLPLAAPFPSLRFASLSSLSCIPTH